MCVRQLHEFPGNFHETLEQNWTLVEWSSSIVSDISQITFKSMAIILKLRRR